MKSAVVLVYQSNMSTNEVTLQAFCSQTLTFGDGD